MEVARAHTFASIDAVENAFTLARRGPRHTECVCAKLREDAAAAGHATEFDSSEENRNRLGAESAEIKSRALKNTNGQPSKCGGIAPLP
jgi:hypothetical protein